VDKYDLVRYRLDESKRKARGRQTDPGPIHYHGQLPPPHGYQPPPYQHQYYQQQVYAPPPYATPPPPPPGETHKQKVMRRVGLVGASAFLLIPFLILLTVFLLIVFVGKPYIVHGESMMPTIHNDDRVFVVPYRGGTTPSRGDVVVLKDVPGAQEMLIKRIVAIGGDRVMIENGDVIVNDKYRHKSTQRYVSEAYTQLVPDNYVFVMGDNEAHSLDSRTFGAIPVDRVVGKALVIFWPPSDLKKL